MTRSEAGKLGSIKLAEKRKIQIEEKIKEYLKNPNVCCVCGSAINQYEKRFNKTCTRHCAIKLANSKRKALLKSIICEKCGKIFTAYTKSNHSKKCPECNDTFKKK